MNTPYIGLVATLWFVCAAVIVAGTSFCGIPAAHPFGKTGTPEQWAMLLFFAVPYLVVALAAFGLRTRPVVLVLLLLVTTLCGLIGTAARFQHMQFALEVAEANSQGRRGPMSCGPPPILFVMFLEYFIFLPVTLIFGCLALFLAPKPFAHPVAHGANGGAAAGSGAEEVGIQRPEDQFRDLAAHQGDRGEFMAD